MTRRGGHSRLISVALLLSLIAGLLVPASAATGGGIPIRVTRPDEHIGSFIVWAEECDESGNPTGSTRYECADTPAPGQTMDYIIPVPFPDHRQDYLVHVTSVPDQRFKGFFTGTEKTMVWTYYYVTGLTLEPTSLSLKAGNSQTLTPVFEPAQASAALNWQSSDEAVATVDETGNVTAVSWGSAVITASIPGSELSASCNVTVTAYEPPTENATCEHADGFHGGTGTEADPYRIYSTADFNHIVSHKDNTHFRQEMDIDFGGGTLVGTDLKKGSYDGGYHVIKNFTPDRRNFYGSPFVGVYNSTIERLGIENAYAYHKYAAVGLASILSGSSVVRECYTLNCNLTSTEGYCGGLVGVTQEAVDGGCLIERCYVLGATLNTSNSASGVGGILGETYRSATMTDCYAIPYSASGSSKPGGLVGHVGAAYTDVLATLTFAGPSYFYPLSNNYFRLGYNLNTTYGAVTGANLIASLNPITEFSKPDNFAFSDGDWVWREVKFNGAESGMKVPTIAGFAHQG